MKTIDNTNKFNSTQKELHKYKFLRLSIETTRRCNYNCLHCGVGQAQNITITPEIIDTTFSQISELKHIAIVGGEPLLELDMFQYLVESIDKYQLNTEHILLTTNGSILDSRFIDILNDFIKKDNTRTAQVNISDDKFHNVEQSEKAFNFYQSLSFDKEKIKFYKTSKLGELNGHPAVGDVLDYIGNAKKYIDDNIEKLCESNVKINYPENSIRSHQICIIDNTIKCEMELSAKGSLGLATFTDYNTCDQLSIGNVLKRPLKEIFDIHNSRCPYLCDECYFEVHNKTGEQFSHLYSDNKSPVHRELMRLHFAIESYRVKYIWNIRKLIQIQFPKLPIQEILSKVTVFSKEFFYSCFDSIISNDKKADETALKFYYQYKKQFPKATSDELHELSRLAYFLHKFTTKTYPFFSVNDLLQSEYFAELARLEQDYIHGRKTTPPAINVCAAIPDTDSESTPTE